MGSSLALSLLSSTICLLSPASEQQGAPLNADAAKIRM